MRSAPLLTQSPSLVGNLLDDLSLEVTGQEVRGLADARRIVAAGSQIAVTWLPSEGLQTRIEAAREVRRHGFRPVPHIAARQLASTTDLAALLDRLRGEAEVDHVFVIAGDCPDALGPYRDALALIGSGELERQGIRRVGVGGYPTGHPQIPDEELSKALRAKQAVLRDIGQEMEIVTQFGFDAAPILAWLAQVRADGVDAPVRVGVAGPANARTLLRFAARCGVAASTKVLAKYGVSLGRLLGTAGPDRLVHDLMAGLDPALHGSVKLHIFPFGGLSRAGEWARDFRARP
jgi:methylenetetrahydrofolate reductase (NADPH)